MEFKRMVAVAVVAALFASAILFVSTPRVAAAVGPKTIVVDGDPIDWTGVNLVTNTGLESASEFVWNDIAGDDTGDGDYTYPYAADLNVTGLFDISEVRVTADATNLYLLVRIGDLNNPWSGADGFSTVTATVLISTAAGGQTTARPNLLVSDGWEYWVKLGNTGWHAENAKVFDAAGKWAPIPNRGSDTLDAIEASIPLSFIAKDGYDPNMATWSVMVFLGGFDGGGPNGFRDVQPGAWCCEWAFGGGEGHANDPQVVDIAFTATQLAQEAELNSYTPTTPATVSAWQPVALANLNFIPDTAAPTITPAAPTLTFNSARVEWTTNEIANTMVHWGTTSGALTNTESRDEFVMSHSILVTGLSELTTYYYTIESCDIADNCATTSEASFTTPAAPPSNIAAWVGTMFTWKDRTGDDVGDGDYVYPTEPSVDWAGKADITWINMTKTSTSLHIQAKVNANADPGGDWKQRMASIAIFIDQDRVYGSGATSVGLVGAESTQPVSGQHPLNLSVAQNFGFEYLVIANFMNRSQPSINDPTGRGEMMVFNSTYKASEQRWSLIFVSSAPQVSPEPDTGQIFASDGNVVDLWLNFSVIGDGGSNDNWNFFIAGMVYDDAARPFENGGIRSVKTVVENWAGGGANADFWNPNVYDLAFYPDTASQATDLSSYSANTYATITRGVRVNFATQTHQLVQAVPLTHSYALAWTATPAEVDDGEQTTVQVTFTDNSLPVVGGTVRISTTTTAGTLVGNTVRTTDANGRASFTFEGGSVTQDTTAPLSITASNDTATDASTTATVIVKAPPPTPPPPSGLSPAVIAAIVVIILIAIVAIAFLVRRKKAPGAGGETGGTGEQGT